MIHGKFIAINAANMSCACPRSPRGLSPSAHLADGTADLILVRECSRLDFFRHLLRHTNKDDQVGRKHVTLQNIPELKRAGKLVWIQQRCKEFTIRFFPKCFLSITLWQDLVLSISSFSICAQIDCVKSVNERAEGRACPLAVLAPPFADSVQFLSCGSL